MSDDKNSKESVKPLGSILFNWLDYKHSSRIIISVLVVSCIGLGLSDFIYHRHGHFHVEEFPGFFAIYGFLMFSFIIFGATLLRVFIKRKEDYYGSKAVDSEVIRQENPEDNK
jgi:hypothetical protein